MMMMMKYNYSSNSNISFAKVTFRHLDVSGKEKIAKRKGHQPDGTRNKVNIDCGHKLASNVTLFL